MEISVKHDFNTVIKDLTRLQREQIPFATARALTNTAWNAREYARDGMERDLSKPKNWLLNSILVKKATKAKQVATIHIKPPQYEYLRDLIYGNTRQGRDDVGGMVYKRKGMSSGAYHKLVSRPDTFFAVIRGVDGLWRRLKNNKLKLLVTYRETITINAGTYRYHDHVAKAINDRFIPHFNDSLRYAFRNPR